MTSSREAFSRNSLHHAAIVLFVCRPECVKFNQNDNCQNQFVCLKLSSMEMHGPSRDEMVEIRVKVTVYKLDMMKVRMKPNSVGHAENFATRWHRCRSETMSFEIV